MAQEYTTASAIPSDFPAFRTGAKPVKSTVYLTQAEYDALTPPDPDVLYVITE